MEMAVRYAEAEAMSCACPRPKTTLDEAIEEQRKHSLTVAIATAVTAAKVVCLTGASSEMKFQGLDPDSAAIRIRSTSRARKALGALEGLEELSGGRELRIGCDGWRNWEHGMYSKEDVESNLLRKQDAKSRGELMMQHSYSQRLHSEEGRNARILEDPPRRKQYTRWSLRGRHRDGNEKARPIACLTYRIIERF
ncbi:hypothetical protein MLD38_025990 [Melastoma candidum]|uniref:Uncharacterized protein n=1 Tax=Melastoma candidum TaxID=119954 RepID=A0ACB9P0N9_9MYRT|nr:hypothetical protein MLD38_025990 [Melastoma candidum]